MTDHVRTQTNSIPIMTRRSVAAGGLALGALLASRLPVKAARRDDTLNVAFPREVRTLDALYSNIRELDIVSLLIDDALFAIDGDTHQIVPLAAKSGELVADKTFEIELRDDVLFHDGSRLTAEDVVYTLEWMTNDKSGTEYVSRFRSWLEKAEALSPTRVRISMKSNYAFIRHDLAMYAKIRKKGTYHDASKPDGIDPNATVSRLNGTGPYRVAAFRPGETLLLERNPAYRKDGPKGTPAIGRISIRIIPDFTTQAAEVMAGGVDWTFGVPTDIAEDVGRTGRAQVLTAPSLRIAFIVLDAMGKVQPNGPLTKLEVRQALNHATDRGIIATRLERGKAQAIHTPCLPVQFGCAQEVQRYDFNPQRARELLAAAGYPNGFEIELWTGRDRTIVEAIAQMWGRVGVRVRVRNVPNAALTKALQEKQVAAYFTTYGSFGIPDAGAILPDRLGRGYNSAMHGNVELEDSIIAAQGTFNQADRQKHFRRAVEIMADNAFWVPVFEYTQNFLMSQDVVYAQSADGMPRLFLARWK